MRKVLAVDDDPVSLEVLSSILKDHNYEVLATNTAKNAIDMLKNEQDIELIISDVMMPKIDGFDFLRRLKTDKRLQKIPVILCTALSQENAVSKGIDSGASHYITKPIKEKILLDKIDKVYEATPGFVLITDSDDVSRKVLAKTIQRDGYKIMHAASMAEAVTLINTQKIAALITDCILVDGDGLSLLALVKEKFPHIPVILIGGGRLNLNKDDVLASGADGFISRPFNNTQIISCLRPFIKYRGVKL